MSAPAPHAGCVRACRNGVVVGKVSWRCRARNECISALRAWPSLRRFSVGDEVTLSFTGPTNAPDPATIVSFSPSIGTAVASWRNGGRLLVCVQLRACRIPCDANTWAPSFIFRSHPPLPQVFTVASTIGVAPDGVEVATGHLRVTVAGVRSASGLSTTSPAVELVGAAPAQSCVSWCCEALSMKPYSVGVSKPPSPFGFHELGEGLYI